MTPEEQVRWEGRFAKPAAVAAFLASAFIIGGTIVRQLVALSDRPDDEREFLIAIDENAGAFLASAFIQSVSFLFLAGVLVYLYRATKARKPEFPAIALVLAVAGAAAARRSRGRCRTSAGWTSPTSSLGSGAQTEKRARRTCSRTAAWRPRPWARRGTLALAIAFVLININAMRVGLLSRFMGIIGAIIGGLYVLPILSGPLIVQLFWLLAIGVLFLGHWPGGRGPAWETGEAEPWPSADRAARGRRSSRSIRRPRRTREPDETPRLARKRKRKKRR